MRLIDPKRKYFACEMYRSNCILINNCFYVKDLRQITRDLSQVIIVDNCITSFSLQLDNGIRIKDFTGDPNDRELIYVMEFLESIKSSTDVRVDIKKKYNYSGMFESYYKSTKK